MPPAATATETEESMNMEEVFRAYHAPVFRAAYRVTGNLGDAEDVLQTVFLRLLRRPGDAGTVENIGHYLHRASVNAALDLLRARQASPGVPLGVVESRLAQPAFLSPDRALASAEIRRFLRAAVARLSPRAAEMFALRYYEGMDNAGIARALDTTLGTVAVTLSRARDRVQQEFEAHFGDTHAPRKS